MLDITYIRENPDVVKAAAKNKKCDVDVDAILSLDDARRALLTETEALRKERNDAAKARDIEKGKALKTALAEKEAALDAATAELEPLLLAVPNVPSDDTPIGKDESENLILRQVGEKRSFSFTPKDHVELGKTLDLIDQEKSAQVSGARFAYLKRDLVLLQHAIVTHTMLTLTNRDALQGIIEKAGLDVPATPFIPVNPPLFVKPEVFARMARLEPKEERYHIPSDDLYLIGSAEHTLGPLHMDEMLRENDLPLRYVAYTPAFRREAGSYGKDTRGIIRLHQFDKIEMESFTLPEISVDEQNLFVAIQEHLVQDLGVPYQVMQICTGDMGSPDHRQIDIECWMPGQKAYRETHTADLMTDYQARRLNTRVKRNDGTKQHVHMNDGTAFALGRIIVAVMENFQREDGTIEVPEVLVPYMGGRAVIGR